MTEVAVVVPGIMGSTLALNGEIIWPDDITSLMLPYKKMAQLLDDNTVPVDVIRGVSISDQYRILLQAIKRCGFDEEGDPPTAYVVPYDWRKKNELAAGRLGDVLNKVVADHGTDVSITLIAHSMGGLVCRYFLESGGYSAHPALPLIKQLITIGTPHRGAPLALTAALGQEKRLFLSKDQVRLLASDPRYPSLYQLMPPAGEPFVWYWGPGSRYEPVDVYAKGAALGLSAANLAAAQQFHAALDHRKRPHHVRYFFFAGTQQHTMSQVFLRKKGATHDVVAVETPGAGDGTVPSWSGMIDGVQLEPTGGEHGRLYRDERLQRTLGVLLGKPGVLAAAMPAVELTVQREVVGPSDPIHVRLYFPEPIQELEGTLLFERAAQSAGSDLVFTPLPDTVAPVRYQGAPAEHIGVVFAAPATIGTYRLVLHDATDASVATTELFVQAVV